MDNSLFLPSPELNHRLTNATEQKDEVTGRDERNELEHKRSLSFQDYDFKAAKNREQMMLPKRQKQTNLPQKTC